jgi:hypothetical protein
MELSKLSLGDWIKIGGFLVLSGIFWQRQEYERAEIGILKVEVAQIQGEIKSLSIQGATTSQQFNNISQRLGRIEDKMDKII